MRERERDGPFFGAVSSSRKQEQHGKSLAVQWLGLHPSTARGTGSIPGQGTKILHTAHHSQKKKKNNKSASRITVRIIRNDAH